MTQSRERTLKRRWFAIDGLRVSADLALRDAHLLNSAAAELNSFAPQGEVAKTQP
jgi:hypothetical protein